MKYSALSLPYTVNVYRAQALDHLMSEMNVISIAYEEQNMVK